MVEKQTKPKAVGYFHWSFRIAASVWIAWFLNTPTQYKSFFTLCQQRNYQEAVLFSFLMSILVTTGVHYTSRKLDQYWPWEKSLWIRIIAQLLLGVLGMILIAYLGVKLYFRLVDGDIESSNYFTLEFPLVQMSIITLNVLYLCYYMIVKNVKPKPEDKFLKGTLGGKSYFIAIADITYLLRAGKVGYIYTKKGKTFHIDYKMTELEQLLNASQFFKVNRSLIVSLDAVIGYKPVKNMQCLLILNQDIPPEIDLLVTRSRTEILKELLGEREVKLEEEQKVLILKR
ncbi:LytR/AlgR family response regulator transcription factor [Pedobacter alpinus]|uniref:LytR/AlgR family response regulator transcription factor n=1 Tax=Pedobacter alpinus TaxID=1590643 RepID=A0ABW5TQ13_9SPHI